MMQKELAELFEHFVELNNGIKEAKGYKKSKVKPRVYANFDEMFIKSQINKKEEFIIFLIKNPQYIKKQVKNVLGMKHTSYSIEIFDKEKTEE